MHHTALILLNIDVDADGVAQNKKKKKQQQLQDRMTSTLSVAHIDTADRLIRSDDTMDDEENHIIDVTDDDDNNNNSNVYTKETRMITTTMMTMMTTSFVPQLRRPFLMIVINQMPLLCKPVLFFLLPLAPQLLLLTTYPQHTRPLATQHLEDQFSIREDVKNGNDTAELLSDKKARDS